MRLYEIIQTFSYRCKRFDNLSSEDKNRISKLTVPGGGGMRDMIKDQDTDDVVICIARDSENQIVAWASHSRDLSAQTKTASIMVYVMHKLRRTGIGTKLFNMASNQAKKAGYKNFSVWSTYKPGSTEFLQQMNPQGKRFTIN